MIKHLAKYPHFTLYSLESSPCLAAQHVARPLMVPAVSRGRWSLLPACSQAATQNLQRNSGGLLRQCNHRCTNEGPNWPPVQLPYWGELKPPCTASCLLLPFAAPSSTPAFLMPGEGKPLTTVSWNKGHLHAFYICGWGILSQVVSESSNHKNSAQKSLFVVWHLKKMVSF